MRYFLLSLVLLLPACASITEGRSQQITINTNPPNATCKLLRKEEVIGSIEKTPGGVFIQKSKDDIRIVCNKRGYQEATYINHSGVEGATFGNIILGGGIGWAIDSASGSDNHYESPVNISLVPGGKHKKHKDDDEDD